MICTEKLPVPPAAGGAVQLYIDGVVPYLSKRHDITVYSVAYPGLEEEEIRAGVRYIRVPGQNSEEYLGNMKDRLASRKSSGEYDIIYVFNRPLWVLALGNIVPDARFILSLHNEMFHHEKISDSEGMQCIERLDLINTVSKFIADGVVRRFPEAQNKVKVIYSGADVNLYRPNWSEAGILNRKRLKEMCKLEGFKVVLFVGRLSSKKGVHILIKAMKRVMESHRDTALVIVGSKWYGGNKSDEYTRYLQNLSKELKGPVIFTGFLKPDAIPPYYNLGDIFVCPSQWDEPLARVHYEAMAAGLPIITTNKGGNAEVIAGYKNGLVIKDSGNPEVMADYIAHLLNNPSRALEMGKRGRELAERKYNWERVAKDILNEIDSLRL